MDAGNYCRDKAAPPGSSLYYATLHLPPAQQEAVIALQAWRAEIAEVLSECTDPGLARIKLQWWREELDRTFTQKPRHPVAQALSPPIQRYGLPADVFHGVVDLHDREIDRPVYGSQADLDRAMADLGAWWRLCAQVCGADAASLEAAQVLGRALELSDSVQDLRILAARGMARVSREELVAFGMELSQLVAQPASPEVREFAALQVRRAQDSLAHAVASLPRQDRRALLSLRILAAIHRATLVEIERDGFRILEHRLSLTPVRKLWLAWITRWF